MIPPALAYPAAFAASFVLATAIIRFGIPRLREPGATETEPAPLPDTLFDWRSTGTWIGLAETFLIFVLVSTDEFGALAIIIGAKEFARSEAIRRKPSYYLLGTLANLAVAVAFALLAKETL